MIKSVNLRLIFYKLSQDGIWEKISAESEEEEKNATKNGTISSRPEFCDLLAERGPCHGSWPRYYYNGESNRCERFFYGGCNGNENNFHVKMACEAICLKPKKSEDATIFDVIFGHPLLPNVNGDMKKEVLRNLIISFHEQVSTVSNI